MDTGRNDLLGEIAADAALERGDFLVQATDQMRRFLDRHKERIAAYGSSPRVIVSSGAIPAASRMSSVAVGSSASPAASLAASLKAA